MIRVTPEEAARFREAHRRHTGEELSEAEARECAERVFRLVAFAAGIDPSGRLPRW